MTSTDDLAERSCVPCKKGSPPLASAVVESLLRRLDGWQVVDGHHLARDFKFRDFAGALAFVNRVGDVAEAEGHHPDMHLAWGRARIEIWTHTIDGLSESDFVLAAKIDRIDRIERP
jgi:4a-hydroxytetrahydrobiopterin dehydratase